MTEETAPEPRSRAKLQDSDEMAERFYRFGVEGMPHWMIAREMDCHRNTIGNFLRCAPKSWAAHRRGLKEADARKRLVRGQGWHAERSWRAARKPAEPKPGETCPTCGQPVQEPEPVIVLTASEMAEARRQLNALIDREIAARKAAGQAGAKTGAKTGSAG